jgi:triacylglycerol lipase
MSASHDYSGHVYRSFPDVEVEISAKILISRGPSNVLAESALISSSSFFIETDQTWPIGALVDIEFSFVDDILSYQGEGRVTSVGPRQAHPDLIGVEADFVRLVEKQMNWRRRIQRLDRTRRIGTQLLVDAVNYFRHEIRGNEIEDKDFGEPGSGYRRPTLVIHGFLGTRGAMILMERYLKNLGFPVMSLTLGALNLGDISKSAKIVAEKVIHMRERFDIDKINVVAHSMGGLIGLDYIKHYGGAPSVRRLVSIGTPYHGAPIALASIIFMPWTGLLGKGVWQLLPGSSFLTSLHQGSLPADVEIINIIAKNDGVISPNRCVLEGARNLLISTNHAGLVVSPKVHEVIEKFLIKK